VATEEDRQEERDRLGVDPSAPNADQLEQENPIESPADPDAAAHEQEERVEEPERQEQREAEEHGSGQGAV